MVHNFMSIALWHKGYEADPKSFIVLELYMDVEIF